MRVGDIMTADVRTVSSGDTVAETAKLLSQNRISSVVVKDGDAVVGIVTERDIVHAVADGVDPKATSVGERMTKDLATVDRKTDVADAAKLMAQRRIRHLPVLDKGSLAGIVSIRDLTNWAIAEMTGGHELPDLERSSAVSAAFGETRSH
jgi:CBS domain-containing protein